MRRRLKRLWIGVAGGVVVVVGLIAIPYPGPGWLIVFAGLAILATEFAWAQHVLDRVRSEYDRWQAWLGRQRLSVRLLAAGLTALLVVATTYLLNFYGLIDTWLHLGLKWLHSPLPVFAH